MDKAFQPFIDFIRELRLKDFIPGTETRDQFAKRAEVEIKQTISQFEAVIIRGFELLFAERSEGVVAFLKALGAPPPTQEEYRVLIEADKPVQCHYDIPDAPFEAAYEVATNAFSRKEYDDCVAVLTILSHLNPAVYNVWVTMGMARAKQDRHHEALLFYRPASLYAGDDLVPLLHAVDSLVAIGQTDDAIIVLEKILEQGGSKEQIRQAELTMKILKKPNREKS